MINAVASWTIFFKKENIVQWFWLFSFVTTYMLVLRWSTRILYWYIYY